MSDPIVVPSARDVRASLDSGAEDATELPAGNAQPAADACVVACPPHPQQRGHRGDQRLVAISDHLTENGIDCLRFDYGDWEEGYGELGDAYAALAWAEDRYDRVAITGFSFGACISLLAAGGTGVDGTPKAAPAIEAVAALAPPSRLNEELVVLPSMERVAVPAQVVYGVRDETADWEPVVEKANELGWAVEAISADHFFVGRQAVVGETVGRFLLENL
jgi:Predicted hydrolase of the alpha/beta superfamily